MGDPSELPVPLLSSSAVHNTRQRDFHMLAFGGKHATLPLRAGMPPTFRARSVMTGS